MTVVAMAMAVVAMAMTVAAMMVVMAVMVMAVAVVTEAEHHCSRRWMVAPRFLQHGRRTESADIG